MNSGPWYENTEKKKAKKPSESTDGDDEGLAQLVEGEVALAHDGAEVPLVEDEEGDGDGHEGVDEAGEETDPLGGVVQEDEDGGDQEDPVEDVGEGQGQVQVLVSRR